MIPTNCHLWQKDNIEPEDFDFEIVKIYWDYSHEERNLVRCKRCGQLYIYDSVEIEDWEEGNDELYVTIIPVSEDELKENDFSKLAPIELFKFSPRILWDSDGSIKWIGRPNNFPKAPEKGETFIKSMKDSKRTPKTSSKIKTSDDFFRELEEEFKRRGISIPIEKRPPDDANEYTVTFIPSRKKPKRE